MDKVEDLGLLLCSSCFYFEDFKGELRRLFHGTQSIETKAAFAVCVNQKVPQMSGRPLEENDEENKIHKGSDRWQHFCCWGILKWAFDTNSCVCSPQLLGNGKLCLFFIAYVLELIHSKQCKTTRRNIKIIRYSNMHVGQGEPFIIVDTQCPPRCAGSYSKCFLCAIINVMNIVAGIAYVTRSIAHMHMVPLQSPTGKLAVILMFVYVQMYMRTCTSCQCRQTE